MTSVLHCVPAHLVEPSTAVLASLDDSVLFQVSLTTQTKGPKVHVTQQKAQAIRIDALPDEVLASAIHKHFTSRDLCSMAQVSLKYRGLSSSDSQWEALYKQAFGEINDVTREAALLAQSWKELFKCKTISDKQAEPWLTPCQYELTAVLQRIASEQANFSVAGGVIFLLDGSGSVSQEDFSAMTGFVSKAMTTISAAVPTCKVGVLQFSNDVHVQIPLGDHDEDTFVKSINDMVRMNGGTDIALAIQTASKHMQSSLAGGALRTLVLLTDGRIDQHQGSEAVQVAHHMAEEQENLSIYAFGVGCGVDRTELDTIVSASGAPDGDCRYMALAVHPESLW